MKKKLLTTLLAFTPFLATANQQPTNAELLTHLKQVKVDIQQVLQDIDHEEKKLRHKWDKDYILIEKTWNDIYAFTKKLKEKDAIELCDKEFDLDLQLNLFCNEMKSFKDVFTYPIFENISAEVNTFAFMYFLLEEDMDVQQMKLIENEIRVIIAKHYKDMTMEEFFRSTDNWIISNIGYAKKYFLQLLKKVDEKVKEFEQT